MSGLLQLAISKYLLYSEAHKSARLQQIRQSVGSAVDHGIFVHDCSRSILPGAVLLVVVLSQDTYMYKVIEIKDTIQFECLTLRADTAFLGVVSTRPSG